MHQRRRMSATIIADASYCSRTKAAGYAYWISADRGKHRGRGAPRIPPQDATVAELMAVVVGIVKATNLQLVCRGETVLIQTDCTSVVGLINGNRKAREGQEEEVFNFYRSHIKQYELHVSARHVKGHTVRKEARFYVNRYCDSQAKKQMRLQRDLFENNNESDAGV